VNPIGPEPTEQTAGVRVEDVATREAEDAREPEAKLDVLKLLQGLASALVLLAGGLYAVGLLIVNVHLSRYGVV
jgi:hypothetical protein